MFCILCQAKIKAIKVSAQAAKLADKAIKQKSSSGVGDAPRKKAKLMKASIEIICKLHCLAAFQALYRHQSGEGKSQSSTCYDQGTFLRQSAKAH
jgi:hypothetical protein